MRIGTIAVREKLSPTISASTTDLQIQEALWHYYYDIDKSVAYLVGLTKPKEVKAKVNKEENIPGGFYVLFFMWILRHSKGLHLQQVGLLSLKPQG
jgi:hypothetical protein